MTPEHPVVQAKRKGPVLSVEHLRVAFWKADEELVAVDDVSFEVAPGEFVGLVGESGSGKSTIAHSVMGLLPPRTATVSGRIRVDGASFETMSRRAMRSMRGRRMALVPQNPLTALDPVFTVGYQMKEALLAHASERYDRAALDRILEDALKSVGITDVTTRLRSYPHECSGGMRQRILLSMALLNEPVLLVADEPTTALDVVVQAQILALLNELVREKTMALLLITHNMSVVAEVCERVIVLRDGKVVEAADARQLFEAPKDPYTRDLLNAAGDIDPRSGRYTIGGGERSTTRLTQTPDPASSPSPHRVGRTSS